ncbi:MAG: hypothetical protein V4618_01515 [Pseudomonadota bacterium]
MSSRRWKALLAQQVPAVVPVERAQARLEPVPPVPARAQPARVLLRRARVLLAASA